MHLPDLGESQWYERLMNVQEIILHIGQLWGLNVKDPLYQIRATGFFFFWEKVDLRIEIYVEKV